MATSRVLVVDDHQTFAELLAQALDAEADLDCVGYARNAAEARVAVRQLAPDIVLMDLRLPDMDGISATADLRRDYPDLTVLILTAHAGPAELTRAGLAGASGFLAKDGSLSDVLDALRSARAGSLVLPAHVLGGFDGAGSNGRGRPEWGLTPREVEVLMLLGRGRDVRGIAKDLGLTLYTSRGYVKSILAKLEVHSQLEAVVVASRAGLIEVGQ